MGLKGIDAILGYITALAVTTHNITLAILIAIVVIAYYTVTALSKGRHEALSGIQRFIWGVIAGIATKLGVSIALT